jgi:serine/threonine-protein kinase
MGQVFRAHDTKLGRDVALKILPPAFATDAARLGRFEREARLLATLNHPNIAQVYDAGRLRQEQASAGQGRQEQATASQGAEVAYIAMELVGGEELKALIARGPLAVADAVPIARQVALALETAHEQGIVHRDLKPANVRIREDGTVKVLDFGLAKAMDADAGKSGSDPSVASIATMTSPAMTQHGVILGTAAYMSPEQAKGRAVDKRADIWAFGLLLRELLTGKQLFGGAGETVAETLGQIFQQPITDAGFPPGVPRALVDLVARCLERDPAQRLRDIGEARIILSRPTATAPPAPSSAPTGRRLGALGFVAIAAVAILSAAAGWLLKPAPKVADVPLRKLDVVARNLRTGLNPNISPMLSPDGMHLLYSTAVGLFVRSLNSLESLPLANTEGALYFTWSPDSRSVAFMRNEKVWLMDIGGGSARAIADFVNSGSGGLAWNDRNEIGIAGSDLGFYVVPATGGKPQLIVAMEKEKESDDHEVDALPGGKGWLVTVHRAEGSDTIGIIANGQRKYVLTIPGEIVRAVRYSSTGHLIFQKSLVNPGIWAVRFSLERLQTEGEPFVVVPDVTQPSLSADGSMLTFVRQPETVRQFVWVDGKGAIQPAGGVMQMNSDEHARQFRLGPDGHTVAFVTDHAAPDLVIYDLDRGIRTRISEHPTSTTGAGAAVPVWTPDGRRLYFAAFMDKTEWNIYSRRVDASDAMTRLESTSEFSIPLDISSDGHVLVYGLGQSNRRYLIRRLDGTGTPQQIASGNLDMHASISPDGQWLAYTRSDGGNSAVYVQPLTGGEGRWQVSAGNGSFPAWAPGGKQLFYRTADAIMTVDITTKDGAFSSGKPVQFVVLPPESGLSKPFNISKDGSRFLMARTTGEDRMTIITNLPEELSRLQAGSGKPSR